MPLSLIVALIVLAILGVGAFGEHIGEKHGKRVMDNKAVSLLSEIDRLLEERKSKKARALISDYLSGESKIEEIIPLVGPLKYQ